MRLRTAPVIHLFFKGIATLIFHHSSFGILAVAHLSSSVSAFLIDIHFRELLMPVWAAAGAPALSQ